MQANRQMTLDDEEAVLDIDNYYEAAEINRVTRKCADGEFATTSIAGRQKHEILQEQKQLERILFEDPLY